MRRSTRVLLGGGVGIFLAQGGPIGLVLACAAIIWAAWPLIKDEEN